MSGRGLADQIRQRHPGIRVVYVTSHTASEIAERSVGDQNVTVVAKPFRAEDLRKAVERVLAERGGIPRG